MLPYSTGDKVTKVGSGRQEVLVMAVNKLVSLFFLPLGEGHLNRGLVRFI